MITLSSMSEQLTCIYEKSTRENDNSSNFLVYRCDERSGSLNLSSTARAIDYVKTLTERYVINGEATKLSFIIKHGCDILYEGYSQRTQTKYSVYDGVTSILTIKNNNKSEIMNKKNCKKGKPSTKVSEDKLSNNFVANTSKLNLRLLMMSEREAQEFATEVGRVAVENKDVSKVQFNKALSSVTMGIAKVSWNKTRAKRVSLNGWPLFKATHDSRHPGICGVDKVESIIMETRRLGLMFGMLNKNERVSEVKWPIERRTIGSQSVDTTINKLARVIGLHLGASDEMIAYLNEKGVTLQNEVASLTNDVLSCTIEGNGIHLSSQTGILSVIETSNLKIEDVDRIVKNRLFMMLVNAAINPSTRDGIAAVVNLEELASMQYSTAESVILPVVKDEVANVEIEQVSEASCDDERGCVNTTTDTQVLSDAYESNYSQTGSSAHSDIVYSNRSTEPRTIYNVLKHVGNTFMNST